MSQQVWRNLSATA